jgi:mannose-6-phosphate isomerase-like protein (cupin superfamily)
MTFDASRTPPPYIAQAGDHQEIQWLGSTWLRILLDSAMTGGRLTVVEEFFGEGDNSPLHVHHHEDEIFCMLEGAMTAWYFCPEASRTLIA